MSYDLGNLDLASGKKKNTALYAGIAVVAVVVVAVLVWLFVL